MLSALPLIAAGERQLTLAIDDIEAPAFRAKGIKAFLRGDNLSNLELTMSELRAYGKVFRNARLTCPYLHLEATRIHCDKGMLDLGQKLPLSFSYSSADKSFSLEIMPSQNEVWNISGRRIGNGFRSQVNIQNGQINRLAAWLPDAIPRPSAGGVQGLITFGEEQTIQMDLVLTELNFSDTAGLRAGEKVNGRVKLKANPRGDRWQWQGTIDWTDGDIFWEPLYFSGGLALEAQGTADEAALEIAQAKLNLTKIGEVEFSASWDRKRAKLSRAKVHAPRVDLDPVYQKLLKPFLQGTKLSDLRAQGIAGIEWEYEQDATQSLDLTLKNMSVEDLKYKRFALFGVNANIPWDKTSRRDADISVDGGELLRIPFGKFHLTMQTEGPSFRIDHIKIPLLDGELSLDDFSAKKAENGWEWQFRGGLSPVSVDKLTQALGLPLMHGKFSAAIPKVNYAKSTMTVDGALLFNMFDGTVTAKNIALIDPLGSAPHLTGDLEMRNLDLNLLTRAFSFGNITGRIDAQMRDVELVNWQPVKFDAKIQSSPGDYPKRISQTAVGHISALGGAGAAAAIQRTFLRFFKTFGYSKIGLSCRLRKGVCEMDGIEPADSGGYVIVKGGGVPAINVFGYNRNVNWQEVLTRVKGITKGEVKPIIK